MNVSHTGSNDIYYLCVGDVYTGASGAGSQTCDGQSVSWEQGDGAIRTAEDPY